MQTRRFNGIIFVALCLVGQVFHAQEKTKAEKEKESSTRAKHKILIVPFEPRLYFGELDYAINQETKMSSAQIKFTFRDGLNEQLSKAFKAGQFAVLDLMDDTSKYRKDLNSIYSQLSYKYLKVPDPENFQIPKDEKAQKTIEKGQLNVETNSDKRFMDARIQNPGLFKQLNAKYRCDLFVFVNQLDLLAGGSNEPAQPYKAASVNRKIRIHYTVFDLSGKEIHAGLLEEEFSPELNAPKKILEKHASKLGKTLSTRISKALGPANN